MTSIPVGWDAYHAIVVQRPNRLAVVGAGYWSTDTRSGLYPGFWGSPSSATIYKADAERTLLAIVLWLTGRATGAKILVCTNNGVSSSYGPNEFQTTLTNAGHVVSVSGSSTSFGAYEPLNFDLVCWDSGWSGGTYHGYTTGNDVADFLIDSGIAILSGTSKDWSRYGMAAGVGSYHAVSGAVPYTHAFTDGPTDWRYQRPFLCSQLGSLPTGGSWNTNYYALGIHTTERVVSATKTKPGTTNIYGCEAPGHVTHGDTAQGVLGLWTSA